MTSNTLITKHSRIIGWKKLFFPIVFYHLLFDILNDTIICRHFIIKGKGTIMVENEVVNVTYPPKAQNPILRAVPWNNLPCLIPALGNGQLKLSLQQKMP